VIECRHLPCATLLTSTHRALLQFLQPRIADKILRESATTTCMVAVGWSRRVGVTHGRDTLARQWRQGVCQAEQWGGGAAAAARAACGQRRCHLVGRAFVAADRRHQARRNTNRHFATGAKAACRACPMGCCYQKRTATAHARRAEW